MPWVWDDTGGRGNSRRRNRTRVNTYTRRSYRNGGYDNGYDADDHAEDFDYGDRSNGDDFDGFYDREGNRVRLTIQTPRDMLPPRREAAELPGNDWPVSRNFRQRF